MKQNRQQPSNNNKHITNNNERKINLFIINKKSQGTEGGSGDQNYATNEQ